MNDEIIGLPRGDENLIHDPTFDFDKLRKEKPDVDAVFDELKQRVRNLTIKIETGQGNLDTFTALLGTERELALEELDYMTRHGDKHDFKALLEYNSAKLTNTTLALERDPDNLRKATICNIRSKERQQVADELKQEIGYDPTKLAQFEQAVANWMKLATDIRPIPKQPAFK